MISTKNASYLPNIERLHALSQSLAVLDAIICPQWDWRCYSFKSPWGECDAMASMRNGSGDGYFLLFTSQGAIIKGFAHESLMSPYRTDPPQIWKGVLDTVPSGFATYLSNPALSLEETTFCMWRDYSDREWQHGAISFAAGADPDGSAELLVMFDGNPSTYQAWAEDNYEREVDLRAVQRVYNHERITEDLIKLLNVETTLAVLQIDLMEIGYGDIRPIM